MKNTVIFDLDGTLWDVTEVTFLSANRITEKHNLKKISKETVRRGFGRNREGIVKLYFPEVKLPDSLKLADELSKETVAILESNGGTLYPDVCEVLKDLSLKYDLYIVSNTSSPKYIEAFLNFSGLNGVFKGFTAAGGLKGTKPEAIKEITRDNTVKSVYVGDTVLDLKAANDSSIPFIWAKYGFGKDLCCEYSINSLCELPCMLKNFFPGSDTNE